jgi:hypothetical protein
MSPSDAALYEETVTAVRAALGDQADAIITEGRGLSVKEVLDEAMGGTA